jgi:hypothetical protein
MQHSLNQPHAAEYCPLLCPSRALSADGSMVCCLFARNVLCWPDKPMPRESRRSFLKKTAAASAATTSGLLPIYAAGLKSSDAEPGFKSRSRALHNGGFELPSFR